MCGRLFKVNPPSDIQNGKVAFSTLGAVKVSCIALCQTCKNDLDTERNETSYTRAIKVDLLAFS